MSELSVGQLKGLAVNNNTITVPSGHKLYAPGHVIQTQFLEDSAQSSHSNVSFEKLSISITPKLASSKIYISTNFNWSSSNPNGYWTLKRNGTVIGTTSKAGFDERPAPNDYDMVNTTINYLDLAGTTSPITYTVFFNHTVQNGGVHYWNRGVLLAPTSSSTITLMEIAQ